MASLRFLVDQYCAREEPRQWMKDVAELQSQLPLEVGALRREIRMRYLLVREKALTDRFDAGREQLDVVEKLWGDPNLRYTPIIRRAAFELRAGESERAESRVVEAFGAFGASGGKLPLAFELAINAAGNDLPA